jgi:hypothetical protein
LIFVQERLDGSEALRALVRLGGVSLARHQVELALRQDCERIVCFTAGLTPDIITLQHQAEAAGARFHSLSGARGLAGLVTAADTVLVLEDGLFVTSELMPDLRAGPPVVYVQPIEEGLAAGFERIDLNHASAGMLRDDVNVFSALQRIALQAAVPLRTIPPHDQGEAFWTLVRSEAQAERLEAHWIAVRTQPDAAATPTQWVMRHVVRAFGATLLDSAGGMASLLMGAGMLLVLALGAGWFGYPVLGLVLAGLAGMLWTIRAMIGRIGPGPDDGPWPTIAFDLAQDAALVALLNWGRVRLAGETLLDRVFPALALLLLLRLVTGLAPQRWRGWLADRTVLALALGAAMALNASGVAVQIAILACAGLGILFVRDKTRLTQL